MKKTAGVPTVFIGSIIYRVDGENPPTLF